MNLQDPQQIARFKIHLRRVTGVNLNTQRFIDDGQYAAAMLDAAEAEDDETLVGIAVALRLPPAPAVAAVHEPAPAARTKAGERTYLFGARGG
jgi:hypothetical protein